MWNSKIFPVLPGGILDPRADRFVSEFETPVSTNDDTGEASRKAVRREYQRRANFEREQSLNLAAFQYQLSRPAYNMASPYPLNLSSQEQPTNTVDDRRAEDVADPAITTAGNQFVLNAEDASVPTAGNPSALNPKTPVFMTAEDQVAQRTINPPATSTGYTYVGSIAAPAFTVADNQLVPNMENLSVTAAGAQFTQDIGVPAVTVAPTQPAQYMANPQYPIASDNIQQPTMQPRVVSGSSSGNSTVVPQYGQALVWKSERAKASDELKRTKARVKPIAPELFNDHAYPTSGPANIFPRNTSEWMNYKSELAEDRLKDVTKSLGQMQSQLAAAGNMAADGIPREQRVLKPAFGTGPGQKNMPDIFGSVLSQPTIWSTNGAATSPAAWPTQAEFAAYGDNRPTNQFGARVDRALPPPRFPAPPGLVHPGQNILPAFPMDQTGGLYRTAEGIVRRPYCDEVEAANKEMDEDPEFEAQAMHFLGADLMAEIGRSQKKSAVPSRGGNTRRRAGGAGAGGAATMSEEEAFARQHAAAAGVPVPPGYTYVRRDPFNPNGVIFADERNIVRLYSFEEGWVPKKEQKQKK